MKEKNSMLKNKFIFCSLLFITSCRYFQQNEKNVAEEFLTDLNRKNITNKEYFTDSFKEFSKGWPPTLSNKWDLNSFDESDSVRRVESKSIWKNVLGKEFENIQTFWLRQENGKWKIFDSFNLIDFTNFNIKVTNPSWNNLTDHGKVDAIENIKNNLSLKILEGPGMTSNGMVKGEQRLINTSNFNLDAIYINIEYLDSNKVSVNSDHVYFADLPSKGYRDRSWATTNCNQCYFNPEFKIKYFKQD